MSNLALLPPTAHCAVADRVEPYGLVANGYGPCTALSLDKSGRHVAAGYERGALFVWDLSVRDAAPARAAVAAHAAGVRAVTWLSSTSLATSGGDQSITVWRLHLGRGRLFCRARAAFDGVSLDSYDRSLLAVSTQVPPRVFACRDLPLGNETEFEVGDRVQARWNGEPTWYVGTLTSVNPYAIDYDDGDHEDDVDLSLIRASRLPDPPRYPTPDAAPPTCSTVLEGRDVGALCDVACFANDGVFAAKGEDCWCGEATLKLHGKVKAVASASKHVACACSDGAVRILKVDTSIILLHSLRNPIDKVQFSSPSFGAGGEHLVAAAHVGSQVQFYVWEVQSGHCLARPRDDDKDSQDRGPIQALACHANGAVICTAAAHASQHAIRVWAAPDGFSWRAYAPNFEELHENITYNEREDEFDTTVDSKAPSHPQAEIEALLGAHGCTLDDVLRVEPTVFDAASGEWVPNADGTEELAFDDTWSAPERARFRRALAALQGEDEAEAPAAVEVEVVAEESELLDAVGLPPRSRSRSPSPAPSWSSEEDEEPPASPASSPSLPSSSPSLEPAPKVTPPSPPASPPRETTKASPLRVKQVARQRKTAPPPPAVGGVAAAPPRQRKAVPPPPPPPAVVELAAAPPLHRATPAAGDWRIIGAHVQDSDDATVRGVVTDCTHAFKEVTTTTGSVVMMRRSKLTRTTLTDEEVALCARPTSLKDYVQARIDGTIRVSHGENGREFKNCYTCADGTERRQFEVKATHVRCALCGDAHTWSLETDSLVLLNSLKQHCGQTKSNLLCVQQHLDRLDQSVGAGAEQSLESDDDDSEDVQSACAESENDELDDEWGAEQRPTRRHLVAAAEAAPAEQSSEDEDLATLRKAKPTNKPRDASMAPEPVTINAHSWRCVGAHTEDANDPTVRGIITSCPSTSTREVTTTTGTVVILKTTEIIQTTLTDDEVARAVRPTSMKDYVQARIDGTIETRCGGRDYKNCYTAADGTARCQFKVTATHVQCAICPDAPTWSLDADCVRLLKEHCGQTGGRVKHVRSLEASLASRALPSPKKAPPMSPAPIPKRKKPSPLATEKKASPLATDPRKRAKQLSGAEAAQARAEAVWAGLTAPSAPPPPPTFPPSPPPHPPIYFDVYTIDGLGGTQLFGRLDLSGAERLTFGRDGEHVDVPLDHVSISRHHATIRFEGDVTYIADMKSNNGTFVVTAPGEADERVTTSRLREGSVLRFGLSPYRYVLRRSEDGLPRPAGDTWPRLAEIGSSGAKRGAPIPKKPDAPPIPKRVRPESLAAVPPPPSHDRRGDWRGRAPHEGDRDRRGPSTSPRANFGERLADRAARFGPPPGPPPFEARLADRAARFSPPPSPRGNFGEKKAARAARFGPPPGPSPFEARLADRAARFSPPPSPRAGDAGGGHRGPRGPEAPHGFGPTALSEALSHRLNADALRALAELETADADAVLQRLEKAGSTVRNPSTWVCQAAKTLLRAYAARRPPHQKPPGPPPRRRGVCQWFDPERKHGFIKPDGGGADLFVHQMDLRAGTEITEGDAVEFGTADYQGREKAVDVTKVERYAAWGVGPLPDGANPRKVSVGNIIYEASESEIKAFFAAVGEMTDVQYPLDATGRPKGICFITFASAEAASRAIATMNNAEFGGRKLRVGWPQFDRCQFSHDGPQGRGRGGFAGTVLARHCADARSAAPGDGHREPRGPAPPHDFPPRRFGPTALSEAVRRRLHADALRALAELETADADAVVQRLTQKGAEVLNPSAFVCQAVKTILRDRRDGFARPGVVPPLPDGANPRKVRVKNITFTASEPEIKAFFAAAGEMTDVQLCRGHCFITFASAEAASRAIATMNNAEFQGRKLRVGWPVFDRCRGGFAGADIARHCADGRSTAAGGREPPRVPLDSLQRLPPPSARGNMAPRPDYPRPDQRRGLGPDEWICGACGGDNFARRRECRRCGTPKSSGEHWETNYGFQVPRPTPPRRRSSSRSRSRSRERRGRRGRRS